MNEELFASYMNESEARELIAKWLGEQVYARLPKAQSIEQEAQLT